MKGFSRHTGIASFFDSGSVAADAENEYRIPELAPSQLAINFEERLKGLKYISLCGLIRELKKLTL